jgi:signal transduction histidine kinase
LLWLGVGVARAQAQEPACTVEILSVQAAQATADGAAPGAAAYEFVTLPDAWQRRHPDFAGGSVWYRIEWRRDCVGAATAPVALLLQSVVLAGEAFVNGHPLWRDESLSEPLSRSWNLPRQWTLPEAWLQEGVNTLDVRVVGLGSGQSVGLGPVFLGAPRQIEQLQARLQWRFRTLFEINLIVSVVIGTLFFCVWVIRRDQSFYGWYALSSLLWVISVGSVLATSPWPFTNSLLFARFNAMVLLGCIASFCLFTWRFGALAQPRIERALWGVTIALIALLALVPDALSAMVERVGFCVAMFWFVANCLQFAVFAWRTRKREHEMLALCLAVQLGAGVHDVLALLGISTLRPIFPYTNIVSTLALAGIMGLRHERNLRRIERFNDELAASVAQARGELATTLEREYALTLANTRLSDRLQVAHDLHDGLGGALVHMMASVERGADAPTKPQVLSMLKFIRNDLRQTIDSNSAASVTVPATPWEWIAPLRHRFTNVFDELGIASEWHLPAEWRAPPNALQYLALTRLVEEALTNVIKHSRAQRVLLRLDQSGPDALLLTIEDDGIGFDVEAVRQADISIGMRSMSARIARVGGVFEVSSRPGRTVLIARVTLARE